MNTLAIDPGLRHTAWSLYVDGGMEDARLVTNPNLKDRGPQAWRDMADEVLAAIPLGPGDVDAVVVEVPQVYGLGRGKGDPSDLIELTGVVGAIVGRTFAKKYIGYAPREWKGQVPKAIHNTRVLAKLLPFEKGNIKPVAASLMHNVIDAIGIGMFYVLRTGERQANANTTP